MPTFGFSSLTEEIKDFAVTFVNSLESCLENSPALLKNQKLRGTGYKCIISLESCGFSILKYFFFISILVAKNFVRLLKRNMTFISLAQVL